MKNYPERREVLRERKRQYQALLESGEYGSMRLCHLKGNITRTVNELSHVRPFVAKIQYILEKQRTETFSKSYISPFPHIADHKRVSTMWWQSSSLVNMMQRAFSLPEDYFIEGKNATPQEHGHMVQDVVIHPEKITWELLEWLGLLFSDQWKSLSEEAKLDMQIASIPYIKEVFQSFISLPLASWRWTARVLRVCQPGKNTDGRYIVFRETSSMNHSPSSSAHKTRKNTTAVSVYYDMFSFVRSQEYAIRWLKKHSEFLSELLSDIQKLRIQWYTLPENEQKSSIDSIHEKLMNKYSFYEEHALKERLEKITLEHLWRDSMRLLGLYNDLIQSEKEKAWKIAHIWSQSYQIRESMERTQNGLFQLGERVFSLLETIDMDELERVFMSEAEWIPVEKRKFPVWISSQVGNIWHTVRSWVDLTGSNMFLGHPFSDLHDRMVSSLSIVRIAPANINFQELKKFIGILKKSIFRSFIYELHDSLKTGTYVQKKTILCQRMDFISQIFSDWSKIGEYADAIDSRYIQNILSTIGDLLSKKSPSTVIAYIESEIPFSSMR